MGTEVLKWYCGLPWEAFRVRNLKKENINLKDRWIGKVGGFCHITPPQTPNRHLENI